MSSSRAIVIGAGVAGLLAAAALSDTYGEVLVLERDDLDDDREFRPGVPQACHFHGLLIRGAQAVEYLLPGIQEQMRADGAPIFDMGLDVRLCKNGRPVPPRPTGMMMQTFSRPFFERHLRARVTSLPAVKIRDQTSVTAIQATTDGSWITGVTTRNAAHDASGHLQADLVVDASGRTSQTRRWLTSLGYRCPPDKVVDPKMSYTTVWPDATGTDDTCRLLYEFGKVGTHGRGGGHATLENGRKVITVFGQGADRPPATIDGFTTYLRELGNPMLTQLADELRPELSCYRYAQLANRQRPYHRMRRWPQRFLVVGDAACVFNPVYAQGMTVAALHAETLHRTAEALQQHPSRAKTVQRRLARQAWLPWIMATAQDVRWVQRPPIYSAALGKLLIRLLDRCAVSPHLYIAFFNTWQLTTPTALLHPRALAALLAPASRNQA